MNKESKNDIDQLNTELTKNLNQETEPKQSANWGIKQRKQTWWKRESERKERKGERKEKKARKDDKKKNRKAKLNRSIYKWFYICIVRNNYNRRRAIRKQSNRTKTWKRKFLIIFKKVKSTASQKANIEVEVCGGNEQCDFFLKIKFPKVIVLLSCGVCPLQVGLY